MNIFKYFPYTKTINSIIDGFRLYEGDGDGAGGGGSAGSSNTGDGSGSAGSGKAGDGSGGNQNTLKLEDIPQELVNQLFNKGFAKGKDKVEGAVKEKLAEMGVSTEDVERWKKGDADTEANKAKLLLEKGEFEKLKKQIVDQHTAAMTIKDTTISKHEKTIHTLVVRNQIIAEAAAECVNPAQVADLLEDQFKSEEINGAWHAVPYNGDLKLVDDKGEPQTVKAFIENWLKIEANSYHKKSNVGTGGTGSGTGQQGYKKDGTQKDKKFQTSQGAIKAGLKSGSKIFNQKTAVAVDE